ncbi:MAG TPA: hypothetical protein VFK78_04740 [Gemmatimonadales bacterium]|nr:hypothetical protein [Gemmatimonadales bacterium]
MAVDLGKLVTRNWPIKLAALLLAVMLYIAVAAQQPITQTFALRLVVRVPPGRTLEHQPPGVSVVLSGRGRELLKLRSFPHVITVAVPDTLSSSIYNFSLRASDVPVPLGADVQVADIVPREITIGLDSVVRKEVRVAARVRVVAESGYVLHGGLTVTPSVVRVIGPEQAVAAVESVATVPTEISDVNGPFSRTVPLDTASLGLLRVAPQSIEVSGELGVAATRTFANVLVESGAGAPTTVTLSPAHVTVEVTGPDERVQALTRDSVRVIMHVSGGAGAPAYARLTVVAPPGIHARAVPDSVLVRKKTARG